MTKAIDIKPDTSNLDVRPITPAIGAEIHNVKLSGDLEPKTVAAIRDAVLHHKVVFLRDQQHLDEAGQQAFGRLLGPIETHPTAPALSGTDYVLDIDGTRSRANAWHTDVTFVEAFPQFSILRGVVIPAVGGDTLWANTVAAYRDLPDVLRATADTLWGRFSNLYDYVGRNGSQSAERERYYNEVITSTIYETDHPIVQIHPITGERALILGYQLDRLIGLNRADSQRLFAILQDYITRPENVARWRWHVGDVAIWDNRATQHKAVDDYGSAPRIVRRVVVSGPVSVGIDGRNGVNRTKTANVASAA